MNFSKMFFRSVYRCRSRWEDWRIGKRSLEEIKTSRFKAQGAEATQSSDYRCLDHLFRRLPLTAEDVLVDVGCGEGRVLTYLYLRRFKGKLIGVELDPEVAETARKRVERCANIEIRCANILESPQLMEDATVYYLFNPFNGKIFSKFIDQLEKHCTHPVRIAYLFDYYAGYLDDRPGWTRLTEETVSRRGNTPAHFSIYRWSPIK